MAKKTQAKKHTHKYRKIDEIWHCALSDCTHFMPKNVARNIEGKNSVCWGCGEVFMLNEHALKMEQPECENCTSGGMLDKIDEVLEDITPARQKMFDTLKKLGM